MRYIDADKLIAEIERRKDEWQALINKNNAVNPTVVKEVIYEDLNILDIITSLKKQDEQNPAWSEEDEEALRVVTNIFEQHGVKLLCYPAFVHWLKTLPNRITFNPYWKPSDEQMEYLAKAITTLGNEGDNKTSAILCELRTDLKKLKG